MLGKLKEGMGGKALATAEKLLADQLSKLADLPPETVRDDDSFRKKFVTPAILAVTAASAGATAMIPRFGERAEKAFFRLRDDLVVEREGKLALINDYRERLPGIVKAAFAD